MSGIAAIFHTSGAPVAAGTLQAMLEQLAHRGPEGTNALVHGPIGLAQAMNVTTPEDLDVALPLRSRAWDVWLVADARIDNREELLVRGAAAAERRRPLSDPELLLWAYERWGEACVEKITGDFAFILWDGRRRKLLCARDPLGVRPLFYCFDGSTLRCASEMQPLFVGAHMRRRICLEGAALFLSGQYVERDQTLYEGVHALPPGHKLVFERGLRTEPYWQPPAWGRIRYRNDEEYAQHFHEVFSRAVACRLRALGAMTAEVSGGLDSSSVVCEAERLRKIGSVRPGPLICLSLVFPGLNCDESQYNEAVARHCGLTRIPLDPTGDTPSRRLAQPHPDVYFDPTVRGVEPLLGKVRSLGARVTLTGLGGDMLLRRTGFEATAALKRGRVGEALRDAGLGRRPWSLRAWRSVAAGFLDVVRAEERLTRSVDGRALWPWLGVDAAACAAAHLRMVRRRASNLHVDPVQAAMIQEITHGPDTTLVLSVNDRLTARFGVEQRHPFLDVRVVETLLSFPHAQRWSTRATKPVLRRAMTGVLPEIVRKRRAETRFDDYVKRCFLEPLWAEIQSLLWRSRLAAHGLVDGDWMRRNLSRAKGAMEMVEILRLVALELWMHSST